MAAAANLVCSVQRMRQPCLGMTRPRCIRSLQLVGPVWGHTCVPGCMTENLIWKHKNSLTETGGGSRPGRSTTGEQTCPLLQPVASGNLSNSEHVFGTL